MFFFNDTATTEIYTLSLHDALPICRRTRSRDMGIISWVAVGLIAGLLAKWFMPGTGPGGLIVTVLIGMAGGFIGGIIVKHLRGAGAEGFKVLVLLGGKLGGVFLVFFYGLVEPPDAKGGGGGS